MSLDLASVPDIDLASLPDRHTCPYCPGKYIARDLKRHIARHKPPTLQCPHCDHKTRQQCNLNSHISAKHTLNYPHECPYTVVNAKGHRVKCDAKFNSPGGLTRHKQVKHASELPPKVKKAPTAARRRPSRGASSSDTSSSTDPGASSSSSESPLIASQPEPAAVSIPDTVKQEVVIKEEVMDGCLGLLLHDLNHPTGSSSTVTGTERSGPSSWRVPSTRAGRFHPYRYNPAQVAMMQTMQQHAWMLADPAVFGQGSLDYFENVPSSSAVPMGPPAEMGMDGFSTGL
ncbi:hypothetical protein L226DRAFT_566056 [Lentinus tigrinus ALCF2SS1-7]|uniref:C2H2-type domain-containing protein n=1 Tax=Lentinus tigrinus ALCF2SS1-6 TaxID=1328759 RepID=A0A5C2SWU7_9APHY|nr:hypothetical protein L227DRAFT_648406 [Lentinus tigrinus ALCF2SS1-6]RPD81270.1 hypothetical protein L226DRAFT_566056 [Lentinus tigrinus ALCF2SS1-7]